MTEPTENAVEVAREAYDDASIDARDGIRAGWNDSAIDLALNAADATFAVLEAAIRADERSKMREEIDAARADAFVQGYNTPPEARAWVEGREPGGSPMTLPLRRCGTYHSAVSCNACVLTDEVASLRAQLDALKRYEPSETDIASFATTSIPDEPFRPIVTTPAPGGHDATT